MNGKLIKLVSGMLLLLLASSLEAAVLQSWKLTNKVYGALGTSYGLRLNQVDQVGITGGISSSMIFDFERAGHGVMLQLVDNAGSLELHLMGTAYGALWDGVDDYSSERAGTYNLAFVWRDIADNVSGYDYVARYGIANNTIGAGIGAVTGMGAGTAFASTQAVADYSGQFDHTLDFTATNSTQVTSWVSYGSGHNGDFGFNVVDVPLPGTALLFGLGLAPLGLALRRRRQGIKALN